MPSARSWPSRMCPRPGRSRRSPPPVAATARVDGTEVASGRFVLLYDPAGQRGWEGPLRVIIYIRADLEPEIAADPMLGEVAWSWLTEALDARTSGYAAPSGTVTRVVTEGFGAKRGEPQATGFELRASWSPVGVADLPDGPPGPAGERRASAGGAGRASRRLVRGDVRRGRAAPAGGGGDRAPAARPAARPMREGTAPAGSPAQPRARQAPEPAAGAGSRSRRPGSSTPRRCRCSSRATGCPRW